MIVNIRMILLVVLQRVDKYSSGGRSWTSKVVVISSIPVISAVIIIIAC